MPSSIFFGSVVVKTELRNMAITTSSNKTTKAKTAPAATPRQFNSNVAIHAAVSRATSCPLNITGSLRGLQTNGIWSVASLRPSVARKKNLRADTVAFWLATEMPPDARCS